MQLCPATKEKFLKNKKHLFLQSVYSHLSLKRLCLIGKQSWWSSYSMFHHEWKRLAMIWWFHIQQLWQQERNSVFTLTGDHNTHLDLHNQSLATVLACTTHIKCFVAAIGTANQYNHTTFL